MEWSKLPRRRKMLYIALGVIVLAVILGVAITYNNNRTQVGADTATDLNLDSQDLNSKTVNVLVKVIGEDNIAHQAFVDAFVDDGDCQNSESETTGYTGQTLADGTVQMTLPEGLYVLKATNVEGPGEGTVGVAVGAVTATSCMKVVKTANTDPVVITVK